MFAMIITSYSYIGDPIDCYEPQEFEDQWVEYMDNICWVCLGHSSVIIDKYGVRVIHTCIITHTYTYLYNVYIYIYVILFIYTISTVYMYVPLCMCRVYVNYSISAIILVLSGSYLLISVIEQTTPMESLSTPIILLRRLPTHTMSQWIRAYLILRSQ